MAERTGYREPYALSVPYPIVVTAITVKDYSRPDGAPPSDD